MRVIDWLVLVLTKFTCADFNHLFLFTRQGFGGRAFYLFWLM